MSGKKRFRFASKPMIQSTLRTAPEEEQHPYQNSSPEITRKFPMTTPRFRQAVQPSGTDTDSVTI
jgi:hypothetical protein